MTLKTWYGEDERRKKKIWRCDFDGCGVTELEEETVLFNTALTRCWVPLWAWYMSGILAHRCWMKEDHEFMASCGNLVYLSIYYVNLDYMRPVSEWEGGRRK